MSTESASFVIFMCIPSIVALIALYHLYMRAKQTREDPIDEAKYYKIVVVLMNKEGTHKENFVGRYMKSHITKHWEYFQGVDGTIYNFPKKNVIGFSAMPLDDLQETTEMRTATA